MDHQKARSLTEFLSFNLIGALTTLLGTGVYFLMIKLGWHYTPALIGDYALGICFSFFMNKHFTFRIRTKATYSMFGKMLLSSFLLFSGNLALLACSVDIFEINVYFAQIVSFSVLMIFSFFAQKLFVFRTAQT